jgi:hypothetical protein
MSDHPVKRRKKLIEVAIPLEAINAASARGKSIRHGRPSILGNLFFIDLKGLADSADSVTLTVNEVNIGRKAPHRFRLALVSVAGNQASAPAYVTEVEWGLPGFGDTQITKSLQQLLAVWRAPHRLRLAC